MSESNPSTTPAGPSGLKVVNRRTAPSDAPGVRQTLSATRRWMRGTFSRDQLMSGLKQLAWVAPMTLLIWVYAEREQKIPANDIRFTLEARSSNPRVAVRLREPADGSVSVDLMGARNRLEELRRSLGGQMGGVRFEVPADLREGEHQIPVSSVINRDSRFDGTSLTGSQPTRVTVFVDPIEDVTAPVRIRDDDRKLYDQIALSRPQVKVRIPKSIRKAAMDANGGQLVVYAELTSIPDKPAPGRKADVTGVRMAVMGADGTDVVFDPPTLSASFVMRERAKRHTIKSVPLREDVVNGVRKGLTIDVRPPVLFNVEISGPPEVIDKIAKGSGDDVKAFVAIDGEDVGAVKKKPWFNRPAGVEVLSYEPTESIDVTVTRSSIP